MTGGNSPLTFDEVGEQHQKRLPHNHALQTFRKIHSPNTETANWQVAPRDSYVNVFFGFIYHSFFFSNKACVHNWGARPHTHTHTHTHRYRKQTTVPCPHTHTHTHRYRNRGRLQCHVEGSPDPLGPTRKFYLFGPNFFGTNTKRIFFKSPFNKWTELGP